ncbi:MAG: ABC transporter [Gimesia sp.]|uniref:ABC transporter ATP-binding protein n=1 Tax=Gimesia sp. TaxID=2024833 RepID=UPI000C6BAF6E|nr:ABC transporter ATP-binding protein [Gimesia sp.]MAX40133.1 ABC transporter [Gimesia sp.]
MEYVVQAEKLVKTYGEGHNRVEVLKGLDLAVRPGELFAIMGPSGSGKTTLLNILGLVIEPTEGRLRLGGEDIYNGKRRDLQRLRRERIGFIFQFANLIPFLTARENVLLPLELIGVRGRQAVQKGMELLDYLEVADRAEHLPEQLSGGERQRVAIARALANEPRVILADEPTASLDSERGLSVMRLLRKLSSERGTAILVVTHDTRMIGEVDRVIRLIDGQVVDEVTESTAPSEQPVIQH